MLRTEEDKKHEFCNNVLFWHRINERTARQGEALHMSGTLQ